MEGENRSLIQEFYNGKTIFLTGATGFIGKVLLEKLLRCCPGIDHIYLLVRQKKGKTANERIQDLCGNEFFDTLKTQNPGFQSKLSTVYGDLGLPLLGINNANLKELANNVNIIFHSAAKLGFSDKYRQFVQENLIATSDLVEIAKGFKNLEAFVHVSTAFLYNDPDFTVHERVAKICVSPKELIDALRWMDDDMVDALFPILMKKENLLCPYLIAKALAENVIEDFHSQTATAIVKCAYVCSAVKDPYPGWCDTIQSAQAIAVAIAKGFLRVIREFPRKMAIIPVDVLSNSIIATAWHIATTKPNKTLVVNSILEPEQRPIQGEKYLKLLLSKIREYPSIKIYRYPSITIYRSHVLYTLHDFVDHYIPAMIIDLLLYCFNRKPIMIRLYKRAELMFSFGEKYVLTNKSFEMDNYHMIQDRLCSQDAETFFMNVNIDWNEYLDNMAYLGRKIILKEDPMTINYARKKAKIWLYTTTLLKWILILYFLRILHVMLFDTSP